MKRICKTFMLVAASALAFSACQKEIENPQEEVKQKTTIHFSAQVKDAETKATLIPEDGDARFVAAWEKDDAMDVWASSGSDYLESGRATWNGTDFDLNLEESDIVGQWEYLGYYPSESSISFGSARTQKGNAYNSLFDVMSGTVSYQEAAFGKDKNNKNVVIPMNRLSTILYFHLTSDLDEAITSATLTVEGGNIAAATAKVSGGALVAEKDATNTITLTFAEGTAPSAKEFQLWFNCLPVTATGLELTVTTATKTATLKNTKGKTYAAGKLNKIVKNGLKWEEKPAEVYTKVTSDDALVDGRYLIVYEEGSVAMNGALDAVSNTIGVKMLNGTIAVSDETLGAEFTFVAAAGSFMDAKGNYIGISSDSNGMDIKSEALKNTVSIDEDGNADVKSSGGAYLRFNAASNQNRFRYYKSSSYTGQKAIQLYAITVVDPTKPSLATTPANGETIEWDNDESGAEKAQTITVKLNEAAKGYTISPSESTADWSITDNEDGTITVYPLAANTSETEDKTLDVTITHKDNASLKSVITLKQTHKGGGTTKYTWTLPWSTTTNDGKSDDDDLGASIGVYKKDGTLNGGKWTNDKTNKVVYFSLSSGYGFRISLPASNLKSGQKVNVTTSIFGGKPDSYASRNFTMKYWTDKQTSQTTIKTLSAPNSQLSVDETFTLDAKYASDNAVLYIEFAPSANGNGGLANSLTVEL